MNMEIFKKKFYRIADVSLLKWLYTFNFSIRILKFNLQLSEIKEKKKKQEEKVNEDDINDRSNKPKIYRMWPLYINN